METNLFTKTFVRFIKTYIGEIYYKAMEIMLQHQAECGGYCIPTAMLQNIIGEFRGLKYSSRYVHRVLNQIWIQDFFIPYIEFVIAKEGISNKINDNDLKKAIRELKFMSYIENSLDRKERKTFYKKFLTLTYDANESK